MDKVNKFIASVVGVITAADIILRFANIRSLSFLTKSFLTINLLEIIILLVLMTFVYRFIPGKLYRIYLQRRSEKFWNNWKRFKGLLTSYSESQDKSLQKEYEKIREELEVDFNFFVSSIQSIQKATHRQYSEISIGNLEQYIRIENIWDFQGNPKETNNFDYLIIALKEDWKKPQRK